MGWAAHVGSNECELVPFHIGNELREPTCWNMVNLAIWKKEQCLICCYRISLLCFKIICKSCFM